MKKHRFIRKEGGYKVLCEKTGGTFYTELWRLGKFPQNICPCCNEEVKK